MLWWKLQNLSVIDTFTFTSCFFLDLALIYNWTSYSNSTITSSMNSAAPCSGSRPIIEGFRPRRMLNVLAIEVVFLGYDTSIRLMWQLVGQKSMLFREWGSILACLKDGLTFIFNSSANWGKENSLFHCTPGHKLCRQEHQMQHRPLFSRQPALLPGCVCGICLLSLRWKNSWETTQIHV